MPNQGSRPVVRQQVTNSLPETPGQQVRNENVHDRDESSRTVSDTTQAF